MNRGKHGNLTSAWDRPRAGWLKRIFWKGERQAQKLALPDRLEDDYTVRDAEDENCTPEAPCASCLRRGR